MKSLLFVPAKEKTVRKIGQLGADCYIVDLEDSINEELKEDTLALLNDIFSRNAYSNDRIIVRVNKSRYKREIEVLSAYNVGFMLPKFESPEEYIIDKDIRDKNREIIGLVETPKGIVNLEEICRCGYITTLAFGAEDFSANIGMENRIDLLQYSKSKLVTYARAFGKKVYDTPSFQMADYESFKREVDNAKALGFDGKMAIHPKHIEYINNVFSDSDLDTIEKIVNEYDRHGEAVMMIDGKVYEKMHVDHLRKILKENGVN